MRNARFLTILIIAAMALCANYAGAVNSVIHVQNSGTTDANLTELVNINKAHVTLQGPGAKASLTNNLTFLIANTGVAITVSADNVKINGFNFIQYLSFTTINL